MQKHIISLKSLVGALSRSFSVAQEELTWSQLSSLLEFFHKDGTPKNLKFKIPTSSEPSVDGLTQQDKASEQYEAPILGLISPSPLHIAESKMEFNVSISELAYQQNYNELSSKERFLDIGGKDGTSYQGKSDELPMDIMVDTSSGSVNQRGSLKINIKVKAAPQQDGYDRLISKLSQLQGVWEHK